MAKNFKDFDFCSKENRPPLSTLNLGCAAGNSIIDLKGQYQILNEEIPKFPKECRAMIISPIEKLRVK